MTRVFGNTARELRHAIQRPVTNADVAHFRALLADGHRKPVAAEMVRANHARPIARNHVLKIPAART